MDDDMIEMARAAIEVDQLTRDADSCIERAVSLLKQLAVSGLSDTDMDELDESADTIWREIAVFRGISQKPAWLVAESVASQPMSDESVALAQAIDVLRKTMSEGSTMAGTKTNTIEPQIVQSVSVTVNNWSGDRKVRFKVREDGRIHNQHGTVMYCPHCGEWAISLLSDGTFMCANCLNGGRGVAEPVTMLLNARQIGLTPDMIAADAGGSGQNNEQNDQNEQEEK